MAIRLCRECGFPYWLSKLICWNQNGTITMKANPRYRVVIIEADFLTDLFARIEKSMGISISHLVFEAQRNASIDTIGSQLARFPYSLGRLGPNRRLVVRAFCRLSAWLGQAYARPLEYRPGRGGEALIRNPYNRELMAAIIVGAFESLERRPFEHHWKESENGEIIAVRPAQSRPEVAERMALEYPPILPGHFFMPRCPSCGVPHELSHLRWNDEEGTIIDTRRDVRVVLLDGFVPNVVFRELERELGSDIYPLIIEAEKEYTHRRMRALGVVGDPDGVLPRRERESIYENTLSTLPTRGQGNPVQYEYGYEGLTVTVENPYNEHLLAGQMAALFEAAEGREALIKWHSPQPSSVVFTARAREYQKS